MKKLLCLALAAPLLLVACDENTEETATLAPDAEPSVTDSCGAERYMELVGQTNPSLSVPEGTLYRTYRTGDPVTQAFAPRRLNFEFDKENRLVRVKCG